MDCEDCRHLTVVGLRDTGPRWLIQLTNTPGHHEAQDPHEQARSTCSVRPARVQLVVIGVHASLVQGLHRAEVIDYGHLRRLSYSLRFQRPKYVQLQGEEVMFWSYIPHNKTAKQTNKETNKQLTSPTHPNKQRNLAQTKTKETKQTNKQ